MGQDSLSELVGGAHVEAVVGRSSRDVHAGAVGGLGAGEGVARDAVDRQRVGGGVVIAEDPSGRGQEDVFEAFEALGGATGLKLRLPSRDLFSTLFSDLAGGVELGGTLDSLRREVAVAGHFEGQTLCALARDYVVGRAASQPAGPVVPRFDLHLHPRGVVQSEFHLQQVVEVRGEGSEAAAAVEGLEHGTGEGSAGAGLRALAELVNEDEALFRDILEDVLHLHHLDGEAGAAFEGGVGAEVSEHERVYVRDGRGWLCREGETARAEKGGGRWQTSEARSASESEDERVRACEERGDVGRG